ncbi:MAG: hypothetical protein U0P30_16185 [Vicinamibacterales bacterium]
MQMWRTAVLAAVSWLAIGAVALAQPDAVPLLRVFLTDGSSLTSYGEWVRLDDTVVFSLPLSATATPDLQLVTLPASRVDWAKTERYATTARAVHYASTRAEEDYAQFSNQVAAVLTGIAKEPDPAHRLALAESARAALADWPRQHHGYRAVDVQQMLSLLDEVVSDLRAAAGQDRFSLNLVATTPPPPDETLLPPPTTEQLAQELLAASTLAESPADRMTLLEHVVSLIDRAADLLPATWAARVRTSTLGSISSERAIDTAYGKLATATLDKAAARARAADVRGLEQLRADTLKADQKLGAKRPAQLTAVLAAIDAGTESARKLRLARDQWKLMAPAYRSYQRSMRPALRALEDAEDPLEDIRAQAGPTPKQLKRVITQFVKARPAVVSTNPPPMLASAHALLQSAWDLADNALKLRLRAVETGDQTRSSEASAAAAGALMLSQRARDDLAQAVKAPALP